MYFQLLVRNRAWEIKEHKAKVKYFYSKADALIAAKELAKEFPEHQIVLVKNKKNETSYQLLIE